MPLLVLNSLSNYLHNCTGFLKISNGASLIILHELEAHSEQQQQHEQLACPCPCSPFFALVVIMIIIRSINTSLKKLAENERLRSSKRVSERSKQTESLELLEPWVRIESLVQTKRTTQDID